MQDKARANLKASKALIEARLLDPSMSRLYYALFQAGVHAMTRNSKRPRDFKRGAQRWGHDTICGNASLFRNQRRDLSMFRTAYSLRERADYRVQPVERAEIEGLLEGVEGFVREVCP